MRAHSVNRRDCSAQVPRRASFSNSRSINKLPLARARAPASAMRFDASSVTINSASFSPRDALETLERCLRAGAKYPQLRSVCASWFVGVVGDPVVFVAECIDIVYDEMKERNQSGYAHHDNEEDGDLLICMYLMLECVCRVPGVREGRQRKRFATIVTRGFVKCERGRARAGKLVHRAVTEPSAFPARAVVRIIETFGLEFNDLGFFSPHQALEAVSRFTRGLFDEGKQRAAMAIVFHFSLEDFATIETLQGLVQGNEYSLALEFAQANPSLARTWIEICINDGEQNHNHASLRHAYKAVTAFQLEHDFPDVRMHYYSSTISRMIAKGQFEVALKRAGSDVQLQRHVVESLAAIEQFEYAVEYANRCGLDFNCDPVELARIVARRRATFFQLPQTLCEAVVFVDDEASLLTASQRFLWNQHVVGIDTEWGADMGEDSDGGENGEVATLQISSSAGVLILDIPALLRGCPDTLNRTIGKIFRDDGVLKLGFAVQEDLRRLAKCHELFTQVRHVVDLQSLWKLAVAEARSRRDSVAALPWSNEVELARYQPVGLSTLVAAVLGKPLDKTMRMSDWCKRPLTMSQMEYAALDAWTLVEVHKSLLATHYNEYSPLVENVLKSYEFKR